MAIDVGRITFHLTTYDRSLSPLLNAMAFAKAAGAPGASVRDAYRSDRTTFGDSVAVTYVATEEEARLLATAYYTVPGEAGMSPEAMAGDIREHLEAYGFPVA